MTRAYRFFRSASVTLRFEAEPGLRARRGIDELSEEGCSRFLHPCDPLVVRWQHGLRCGQRRTSCLRVSRPVRHEGLHLPQSVQTGLLRLYLVPVGAEVLEPAWRRESLHRFKEDLRRVQVGAQIEATACSSSRFLPQMCNLSRIACCAVTSLPHEGGHRLLHFLNRFVLALRHELRHAGGQIQQLEHGSQGRDIPLLGAFDVLEVDELIYRCSREDRTRPWHRASWRGRRARGGRSRRGSPAVRLPIQAPAGTWTAPGTRHPDRCG